MSTVQHEQFTTLLRKAIEEHRLVKLTLGKPRGGDATLKNVFIRPIDLKTGPHLSFIYRHETRDVTKNHPPTDALVEISRLLPGRFLDAHLFTTEQQAQLETKADGTARLRIKTVAESSPVPETQSHDKSRHYVVPADAPWLRALGVVNERGQPREGMAAKFRQIQKFAELITHLTVEADLPADRPLRIADMGCGKGYLTFAVAALFGSRAEVIGIERRADLVELGNRTAADCGFTNLKFLVGEIGTTTLQPPDILIALHACDTATDDALAQGLAAQSALLIVSPCCQKELRRQLTAPPVLADALRHGIFQERQSEFVTDAMRAQLLEWSGYRTKVFEFISTEHTAKNLMIAAVKSHAPGPAATAAQLRDFAAFYGITQQQLARHLHFSLTT